MQATHKKLRKGAKCLPLDGYVCRCAVRVDSSHHRVRLRRAHTQARLSTTRAPYGVKRSTSLRHDIPSVRSNVPPLWAGNIFVRLTEPPPFASGIAALVVAAPITASACVAHTTRPTVRRCELPKKQPKKARSSAVEKKRDGCAHRCVRKEPGVRPDIHCTTLPQHTPRLGRRSPAWEARA